MPTPIRMVPEELRPSLGGGVEVVCGAPTVCDELIEATSDVALEGLARTVTLAADEVLKAVLLMLLLVLWVEVVCEAWVVEEDEDERMG